MRVGKTMTESNINATELCHIDRIQGLLNAVRGTPVLVLGDLLLDAYVYGRTERVSREAPVPIMVANKKKFAPGGAANAAAVAASLGGSVHAAGFLGDDDNGRSLLATLLDGGVNLAHAPLADMVTATKTRYLAGSLGTPYQQVLRVDHSLQANDAVLKNAHDECTQALNTAHAQGVKAVLISDYGSGATHDILLSLANTANDLGFAVLVDSRYGVSDYQLTNGILKPNAIELETAVGAHDLSQDQMLLEAAQALRSNTNAKAVLATKGKNGMVWCDEESTVATSSLPNPVDSIDVTGAGDGVAAAALLGLAKGFTPEDILALATLTATFIVSQHGTACPTSDDLATLSKSY